MPLLSHLAARQNNNNSSATRCRVLGVMTGTSLDGVDLALCEFPAHSFVLPSSSTTSTFTDSMTLLKFATLQYPPPVATLVKQLLLSSQQQTTTNDVLNTVCELNTQYSRHISEMINSFLSNDHEEDDGIVIACHGQTIFHISGSSTLQLGDSEVLAAVTGRTVVANFRAADVAVGGCGAPLVPFLDRLLAASAVVEKKRGGGDSSSLILLQNLGGIGNVSAVRVASSSSELLAAFDTGPACVVLNELASSLVSEGGIALQRIAGGDKARLEQLFAAVAAEASLEDFDRDAMYSSRGSVDAALLREWLSMPYFDAVATATSWKSLAGRSAGREQFGNHFVSDLLGSSLVVDADAAATADARSLRLLQRFFDLCATAVAFSVESIALHVEAAVRCSRIDSNVDNVLLLCSGGGASHPLIMRRLSERLAGIAKVNKLSDLVSIRTTMKDESNLLDDAKEAIAFALLGHEKLCALAAAGNDARGNGTNEPAATGASRRVFLGQVSSLF